MKEPTEQQDRRSVKDRRRGFDRRDPEGTVLRVPGHFDRRWPHERRRILRREADRMAPKPGSTPQHGP